LIAYAGWKLPNREGFKPEIAAELLQELSNAGYTTISQINDAINRSLDAIKAYEAAEPPIDGVTGEKSLYAQVGVIRVALSLVDEDYLAKRSGSDTQKDGIRKYRDRIKDGAAGSPMKSEVKAQSSRSWE
ncbi:hypothetical protein ACFLQR_03010, partial [Verrucomicrobiota bacterium]